MAMEPTIITAQPSSPAATWRSRVARLFRFRLLTLLLAMAAISAFLAWKFHRQPITAANVAELRKLDEIRHNVFRLVYSPDRRRVAFVAWEEPVEIREAVTLWRLRTVGEGRKLIDFAFSRDPNVVAFTTNSDSCYIWNLATGQQTVIDTGNSQPDVVFSPDGKMLATGGYGKYAKLWDVATGKELGQFESDRHGEGGLTPRFSPDGKLLAIGNRNSITRIYEVQTGQLRATLRKPSTQEIEFSPDGKLLAVSYVDGHLRLWSTSDGSLFAEAKTTAEEIYTLDWSPDGKLLVSAGLNGEICLWDRQLGLLHSLPAPDWVISAKFSPDGTRLITGGGHPNDNLQRAITVWGVPPAVSRWLER